MKTHSLPRHTYLAILQQAEYDTRVYRQWIQQPRPNPEVLNHLSNLFPEKNTTKLRLIDLTSRALHWFLPARYAVLAASLFWQPVDIVLKKKNVYRAKKHLAHWQKQGGIVIGVAGSFGKTSVKNSVFHVLSSHFFTCLTPASYNTPLGIAQTIVHSLRDDHQIFIVEMGEYAPGDIDELLQFVRPNMVILTPIGFSHMERFGTQKALLQTFHEVFTSSAAPSKVLIDDQNRSLITPSGKAEVNWYGEDAKSDWKLQQFAASLPLSRGKVQHEKTAVEFQTRLFSAHQVRNALPGFALPSHLQRDWKPVVPTLAYHPMVKRRLEVHRNPNGTMLIDNSYNTNPASWQEMKHTIRALSLTPLCVITAGFVEVDDQSRHTAHQAFANDLLELASVVGIIHTRHNDDLIEAFRAQSKVTVVTGFTQQEVLQKVAQTGKAGKYLWLEGGARELYL